MSKEPALEPREMRTLVFDFHGVIVEFATDDEICEALVERDFSLFRLRDRQASVSPQIRVIVSRREPPYARIPPRSRPWIHTKGAAVYRCGRRRFLDSAGRVLVILDFKSELAEIYSLDRDLLHEQSYLMIMSRVGEWLDRRGLHRVHAMGVVRGGRSVLCLMPMGGGKTTLALGLLDHPGFALLSDELPLVSRDGRVHPFPVRIGVSPDAELAVPGEYLTHFPRTARGPKTLIDARYFADRIAKAAEPWILFVGRRIDGPEPQITSIGRLGAFRTVWNLGVRVQGIPQLLEYVVRAELRAALAYVRVVFSRVLAFWRLLRRSECYELQLGVCRAANASRVAEFVGSHPRRGETESPR